MQGIGGTGQKNLPEARPAPERVITGHLTEVVSCAEMR